MEGVGDGCDYVAVVVRAVEEDCELLLEEAAEVLEVVDVRGLDENVHEGGAIAVRLLEADREVWSSDAGGLRLEATVHGGGYDYKLCLSRSETPTRVLLWVCHLDDGGQRDPQSNGWGMLQGQQVRLVSKDVRDKHTQALSWQLSQEAVDEHPRPSTTARHVITTWRLLLATDFGAIWEEEPP